ncbi:MAG: hypothetical protein NVSMB9_34760 [Isosphaeraceae bacterium]
MTYGPSVQDVDLAVKTVLSDRFGAAPHANGRTQALGANNGAEVFDGRLLSLREAETLPLTVREVLVTPGTVVTPLAREFLKRHGLDIRIVARSSSARKSRDTGEWGFAIGLDSGMIQAFRRTLLDRSDSWRELNPSIESAARWVTDAESRGALFLSDESSLAVYRAYQHPGVRAAAVEDVMATARAVRAIGVNLLVVHPVGKSLALLNQMATTFQKGGSPAAPPGLQETTGGRAS